MSRFASFATLALTASLAASAAAQDVSGRYSVQTAEGTLILELRQDASGALSGSVGGLPYPVEVVGQAAGSGIQGQMRTAEGVSLFEGRLSGDTLELAVAEMDGFGRPDASTLQRYTLRRATSAAPAAAAPAAGAFTDPDRGWSFDVPPGWQARRVDGEILLASPDQKGLVVLLPHQATSVQELRAEAAQGVSEEGVELRPSGAIEDFEGRGIAAPFEGTADGRPVKAWGVALVSPHGTGATLLAIAETESFGSAHRQVVDRVARSMRFSRPQAAPEAGPWRQKLAGNCLAYRSSSFSSSGSGGTSFSDRSNYYLAADGRFTGDSASSATFDGSGGFGSSFGDSGPQVGQWRIGGAAGAATLELSYADGRRLVHRLTSDERGRTYLDGDRWLVVSFQQCREN